jgi:flagellar hook protein FlgE
MFTAFSTALSALDATSTAIDVVGNNLANMNTPGYKTSEVAFRDMVTQSIGSTQGETQIGLGTGVPFTIREFTQGAIQTSAGQLDAAIQGDGFFVTQNSAGNTMYTRAGNFQVDKSGNLLTATGDNVQGWSATNSATGQVDTTGSIGNIVVPTGALRPPAATTNMSVDLNLNSGATADATSNFSAPVTVYDSLGTSHVVTLNFQKTDNNTWTYQATVPGASVTAGTAGTPFDIPGASGTLKFDTNGQLTSPAAGSPIDIKMTGLSDGAADMDTSWDPYNGSAGRITQFGQPSATSASAQDGSAPAQLVSVGMADGGGIVAQYSNGQQITLGQVAMASIRNPESLIAVGNNDFQLSSLTASPSVGTPGTGGRGTIVGGATEASTVDMATEFTNLIVYQRGYEANAHVITTADQLSQDTINLMH